VAEVDIRLVLEGGEADRGQRRYEPGSMVRGTVQLVPAQDVRCDGVFVTVGWHTEGRGDSAHVQVGEVELQRGPLTANTPTSHSFAVALPHEPWSYAGHYINIIWEITVVIAIPFAADIKHAEQIVVAPRREGGSAG
jgi:hypothetical protein